MKALFDTYETFGFQLARHFAGGKPEMPSSTAAAEPITVQGPWMVSVTQKAAPPAGGWSIAKYSVLRKRADMG